MDEVPESRLSGLDAAFLGLESEQAPMHLGALAVFQPTTPVAPARLYGLLSRRAERVPRLRRQLGPAWLTPGTLGWTEDRDFAVSRHVFVHRLGGGLTPAGREQLAEREQLARVASELMAAPLDLRRPPWELHLLTGLADHRFGLLFKVHHAMADGLRAVELGLSLIDERWTGDDAGSRAIATTAEAGLGGLGGLGGPPGVGRWLAGRAQAWQRAAPDLLRQAADVAGLTAGVTAGIAAGMAAGVTSRLVSQATGTAGGGGRGAAVGPPASSGRRGSLDPAWPRRLELVQLPLADVRRVRRRCGGTDNDVVLAVIAGALHDWLVERGQWREDLRIRALVPVSRRLPAERQGGNTLAAYVCQLPVAEPSPVARLAAVRREMARLKQRGPDRGPGAVPALAARLPAGISRMVAPLLRHGARSVFDTVVTNVPMPSVPVNVYGAPLRELYPLVPLAAGLPLGIAVTSYLGTAHVSLHADARDVPDLDRLADAVPPALVDLRKDMAQLL